jgi:tRNA (guanine37-N1)-methyltransferase
MPRQAPANARQRWMRIDILSAVPHMLVPVIEASILQRAQEAGAVEIVVHNLHDYGLGSYKQIDDQPFGGGAGMILRCEPVFACVDALRAERSYDDVIFLTPDGERFAQRTANELSLKQAIILLAGHYKGIDQRIRDTLVTREISIGDYVLTGGELPALVLADAIVRLLPGAMSDPESALLDSFQDNLLDAPHYTRPAEFRGMTVPDALQSGNHKRIADWREQQALEKTRTRRPDLLAGDDSL